MVLPQSSLHGSGLCAGISILSPSWSTWLSWAPYSAQCSNSLQGLGGHDHFRDEEIESQRLAEGQQEGWCALRET